MRRSTDRIIVSHAGTLPRPPELQKLFVGGDATEAAFEAALPEAIDEVVKKQAEIGIDVVNDGEFGKSTSWSLYALQRLSGFELRAVPPGSSPFARGADRERFQEFYDELEGRNERAWSKRVWRPLLFMYGK